MNAKKKHTPAELAEETLLLLPNFIADAKLLAEAINQQNNDSKE
jgi:hypothetical protein